MDGFGRHLWNIRLSRYPLMAQASNYSSMRPARGLTSSYWQYAWALELLYVPAIWLAKSSLLFQLIRIFSPMKSGPIYWACHALMWGNLAFYTAILLTLIFECHPIREVWMVHYQGHCIDRNAAILGSGAVNVFSDLLNLMLPMWAVWRLQMATKRKFGIIAIFATGVMYCSLYIYPSWPIDRD